MLYDDAQTWEEVHEQFRDMTIYYIFLLKKGPTWTADETPEIAALAEAEELIRTDPMIQVGRLLPEIHTWMVNKNILP